MPSFFKKNLSLHFILFGFLLISCSTSAAKPELSSTSNSESIKTLEEQYQAIKNQDELKYWANILLAKIKEAKNDPQSAKEIYSHIPKNQAASLDADVGIIRVAFKENKKLGQKLLKQNENLISKIIKADRSDLLAEIKDYKEAPPALTSEVPSELSPEAKLKKNIKKSWNKNEFTDALSLIKTLRNRYPASGNSSEIVYIEAKCLEDLGEENEANVIYQKLIANNSTSYDLKTKSLKNLYTQQLRKKDLEKAKLYLQEAIDFCAKEISNLKNKIKNKNNTSLDQDLKDLRNLWFDQTHFYFWLYLISEETNSSPEMANRLKNNIISKAPLSYYRLLINNDFHFTDNLAKDCLESFPKDLISKLYLLKSANLKNYADNEINWHYSKEGNNFSAVTALGLEQLKKISSKSYLHSEYGFGNKGVAIADNALKMTPIIFSDKQDSSKSCLNNLFYNSYSTPYLEEFQEASERYNVPVSFLLAIARTESFFNPFARSEKDALGMMQLLKSTAEQEGLKNKDNLFDAKTNINFGAKHLSTLLKYYNNNFILAAAAYNAGRDATDRWLERTKNTNFSELWDKAFFIEQISYPETRNYVQRVYLAKGLYEAILKNHPIQR